MVDQLAGEYADDPVVFVEYDVDNPAGNRVSRWWAAWGSGGSVYLPLVMVGGTVNTVRPTSIRGAWTTDGPVKLIDEDQYRQIRMDTTVSGGPFEYLWYNPAYPLGLLYPWPLGSGTMYLDCLKPLTDPTSITGTVSFPPEYDDAMKWNLAVRLCPEYGKEPQQVVAALAGVTLAGIETRNFALQINSIRTELLKLAQARWNIERGD